MKNNKGITLTSLVVYIALVFVVIATLMRITTYFSNNMQDAADVSFETEFQKINLYLLDETKKSGNSILEITEDGKQITFENGNKYTYNTEEKIIYLNNTIKVCESVESCLFEKKTADNGKSVLSLTIKIKGTEKTVNYIIKSRNTMLNDTLLPREYQQVEYIESTGTQYIDTGYKVAENSKIQVDIVIESGNIMGFSDLNNEWNALLRYDKCSFLSSNDVYYTRSILNERKTVTLSKEQGLMDDNVFYENFKVGTTRSEYTFHLFACKISWSNQLDFMKCKIYSFKVWEDNVIIMDYVPCYRKSDNVVGLYDTVNDVFYTNQGTGDFLKGENKEFASDNEDFINEEDYIINMWGETLPAEYQQVEYIESTGTQYIDTGYKVAENSKIQVDIVIESGNIMGFSDLNNEWNAVLRYDRCSFLSSNDVYYTRSILNERKTVTLSKEQGLVDDNVFYENFKVGTTRSEYTFHLFACKISWSNQLDFMKCKIYSFKVWEDNVIIMDYVPCYRKSDNQAGLYDLVNGVFYTNAGTGEFIVGPNVD